MGNIVKRRKKNPFRVSFLCVTIICYVVLSITFYYISYRNSKVTQEKYAQEKLDLVTKDFEKQLQVMKEVAIRIAYNNEFNPYYFKY